MPRVHAVHAAHGAHGAHGAHNAHNAHNAYGDFRAWGLGLGARAEIRTSCKKKRPRRTAPRGARIGPDIGPEKTALYRGVLVGQYIDGYI